MKYYECFSVFLHLFWAVLCRHLWPVWLCHIFHIILQMARFSEKLLDKNIYFDFLCQFFWTILILKIIQRGAVILYTGLHVKQPLLLSNVYKTLIFKTNFRKILKYQISLKTVYWEKSGSMRTHTQTDEQADTTKLTVAFAIFATVPESSYYSKACGQYRMNQRYSNNVWTHNKHSHCKQNVIYCHLCITMFICFPVVN
jgi:hypothetical protein